MQLDGEFINGPAFSEDLFSFFDLLGYVRRNQASEESRQHDFILRHGEIPAAIPPPEPPELAVMILQEGERDIDIRQGGQMAKAAPVGTLG